ncbi:hypothetical protein FE257_007924 [Aspergillus nanangensis]|uniref:Uncharacterized protein n=1 Tax=Aspergillus nanangensis TaxID=2582783 RepID=A0AAD4CX99_ASPNN|nr:hypothetical protein FE257_007924 [Aspergillus nanangensis]
MMAFHRADGSHRWLNLGKLSPLHILPSVVTGSDRTLTDPEGVCYLSVASIIRAQFQRRQSGLIVMRDEYENVMTRGI